MWTRRELFNSAAAFGSGNLLLSGKARAERPTDLTQLSLVDAAALLRRKVVSPVELTQACLARIERLNAALNAFITVTAEQAMRQARDAETEIQRGNWRGPLHGIPLALKDLINTAGIRTTAASGVFKDRIPSEDAEVVRRLKAAGAVLLGKLNMHEFAYGGSSVPSFFGPVHNPWNLDYIAGGSSGGSASAVAANLCYGALGSDTGGSIRQPAAYCSIVGFKPTYGRVSTRGAVPLSWSLDHLGPMCRTVADATHLLQTIAGYDPEEPTSVDAPVPDYAQALKAKTSGLRLGLPRAVFYEGVDPEILAATNQAIAVLRGLTASIREVQLPAYKALPVLNAEAAAYHAPYIAKTPELYQPNTRGRLEVAAKITTAEYIQGRRELDRLRRAVRGVFVSVDLLVTPTSPVPPATIAANVDPVGNAPLLSLRNTSPFDVFGLPTISIPCGFTRGGLPIGLQISGAPFVEPAVIALAHAYEQATEWHTKHPPLNVAVRTAF
ncbi:MAG: amidase [Acidobacteriia bacterium]|nr:amidase [Terriglobia bacterium]MBV9744752.1 amidase [Terriglobia bacterium]